MWWHFLSIFVCDSCLNVGLYHWLFKKRNFSNINFDEKNTVKCNEPILYPPWSLFSYFIRCAPLHFVGRRWGQNKQLKTVTLMRPTFPDGNIQRLSLFVHSSNRLYLKQKKWLKSRDFLVAFRYLISCSLITKEITYGIFRNSNGWTWTETLAGIETPKKERERCTIRVTCSNFHTTQ